VLGSDSYQYINDALRQRLQSIAGQQETAAQADVS
jgi:hypothetical protein